MMKDMMFNISSRVISLFLLILVVEIQNIMIVGQHRSACVNMRDCLKKLQYSDHCHTKGLHFCIHANGMCYGPSQYCEKGGYGKVQQCLPNNDEEALQLCRQKMTNSTVSLPDLQCEWACETRFNRTVLGLNDRCDTPQEHMCPHAGYKCYKPDQYCDVIGVKQCLPSDEKEAFERCKEKIEYGYELSHPQCEWACEFRFSNTYEFLQNGNKDEHNSWRTATILLLVMGLVSAMLCLLWRKVNFDKCTSHLCCNQESDLECKGAENVLIDNKNENCTGVNNSTVCQKFLIGVLLVLPCALAALLCYKAKVQEFMSLLVTDNASNTVTSLRSEDTERNTRKVKGKKTTASLNNSNVSNHKDENPAQFPQVELKNTKAGTSGNGAQGGPLTVHVDVENGPRGERDDEAAQDIDVSSVRKNLLYREERDRDNPA